MFKKICFIGIILIFLISSNKLQSQEPVYPIILIHGLNSDDTTWDQFVDFLNTGNIAWGKKQTFHVTLNADHTSTLFDNDVLEAPGNVFSPETNLFAINFHVYKGDDGVWHFYKNEFLLNPDSQSNESAIYKQGGALGMAIKSILDKTQAEKVILVGHSMGGLAAREYLQRKENGKPKWWAYPNEPNGHRVARLVTTGTPHVGSNAARKSFIPGINPKSEAARDLTYNYFISGSPNFSDSPDHGVYLFGGPESLIPTDLFFNNDVNCNSQDDVVLGINSNATIREDNTSMSLPNGVEYTWIVSKISTIVAGDGAVRTDRQYLENKGDIVMVSINHLEETADKRSLIRALDEPDASNTAYKIEIDKLYNGFTTYQSQNILLDTDWFIFNLTDPGVISVTVSNVTINGTDVTTIVQLFDKNNLANPLASGNNSGGLNKIQFNSPILQPGDYYLKIVGAPKENSWRKPYSFYLKSIGAPKNLIVYASPSAILADGTSSTTISAEIQDDSGNLVPTATNEITFNITYGSESAQLIGSNPTNAVNGMTTISLQSTTTPGMVTIEASSPGLTSGSTSVNVYASGNETEVSGTISANTIWSLANSPYRVTGDVTVAQGATLTIEPGVLVKFNSKRDLFVNGRLVADGLPNQRIAFTSSLVSPPPNAWGGIRLNYSPTDSPSILDNCIISYGGQGGYGNLDAPIIVDARANPQITNTSLSNSRYNGIKLITGTYSSDISLGIVGIPYVLRGDLTIASGTVLNIIPGVLLKFARNADFFINGGFTAEGSANNPIVFTSLRDDTRGGDTGGDGSTVGSVGDWGGIWFDATINDTKSKLRYCEIYFGGQGGYGNNDSPISLDARANPTITNTILSNNRFNGLNLNTGTYSSNIILDITGLPYMIRGDLTVASGAVLTIQPGVLLKFASNSDFNVYGGLFATGTATNHIVFTSFRDDSRGGDTNGDGATSGSPGSWGGIWFGESTDDNNAILRHCEIYFSGQGGYGNNNSPLVLDARANPKVENVILADNRINGIWLTTRTYDVDIDLDITDLPYILGGDLTVGASAQLTIHPGTLLKMANRTDLFIDGTLRIIGQESRPVVFTSFKDDSRGGDTDGSGATSGVPGDWGGIQFRYSSNDAGSVIEYSEFHFGGQGGYGTNDSPLVFDNASPKIQKVLITKTKSQGVRCYNTASPDFGGGAHGSIGGNRFLDFVSNGNKYAIRNDGTADIFAKFNYWETSDPTAIEQIIYDRNDNSSKGRIIYAPFETDPTFPLNAPTVLLPLNGTELLPDGLLVWTEVHPVQNSDLVTYTFQLDDDSTFASLEISQTGITGEAYSTASLSAFIDEAVSLQANAIAVRLNRLTGFDNLIDNTNYYWRVKAVDNYGAESDYTSGSSHFFFNKTNSSPNSVIAGFSPKDGLEIRTSTPEISWHPAADPDLSDHAGTLRYNLQLDDDGVYSNGNPFEYTTSMGLNTFDVLDQLTENLKWSYRVQTIDDEDLTSDWSAIQDFWVNAIDEPPMYFDLLEPLDGSTVQSDSVRLRWQTAIDPDPNDRLWYVLEVGSDSLFKSLIAQVTQIDTSFVLRLGTLTAGTYYWRVKGLDSDTLFTYASRTDVRPWRFAWGVTNVEEGRETDVPTNFSLSQNYPNPFNPITTIAYQLPKASNVTLKIYNLRGQEVRTLVEEEKPAGYYSVQWDGFDKQGMRVSSGVYIYRVTGGSEFTATKKMLLLQ